MFMLLILLLHCKKRLAVFLPSAGISLTKHSLARESLVSDIQAGDGKSLFYSVLQLFLLILFVQQCNLILQPILLILCLSRSSYSLSFFPMPFPAHPIAYPAHPMFFLLIQCVSCSSYPIPLVQNLSIYPPLLLPLVLLVPCSLSISSLACHTRSRAYLDCRLFSSSYSSMCGISC
jgi:hypothetical protein